MNDIHTKATEIATASVRHILCLDFDPKPEETLSALSADSLDRIEIGMEAEDRAEISLTDSEIENVVTVADLATLISGKMAASLASA